MAMLSCEKQNSTYVNLSAVHVYMNNTDNDSNLLAFDAMPTNDEGVVVFGVGGNIKSKFQADGELYIIKINRLGKITKKYKIDAIKKGFPAAVVQTDEGYNIFWNVSAGEFSHIKIDKNTLDFIENKTIIINAGFTPNYITSAIEHKDHFILQGIGGDNIKNEIYKKSFIAQSITGTDEYKAISANEYNPRQFGGFGDEDIAMLQGMRNCFKFLSNNERLYYSSPFNDKMVIKEIGDPVSIYTDANNWISAFITNEDKTFSAVFNDRQKSEVAYYPELNFKSAHSGFTLPDDSNSGAYKEIKNVDTDEAINIVDGAAEMIVVTNNSGQLAIHTYKDNKLIERIIGKNYPYRPIAAYVQNNELILIGNTDVEFQYKRIFLIKIPLSELE